MGIAGLRDAAVTIDVRVREVPLEVQLPAGSLAPVSSPPGTPAPSQSEDEFSTTGTAQPERVAPPAVERQDEPTPQPTPPPR